MALIQKGKRHGSRLLRPSSDHAVLTTGSPRGTVAIGPEHGGSTAGDNAKRAHLNSAVVIYWRVNAPLGPDELADHGAFPNPPLAAPTIPLSSMLDIQHGCCCGLPDGSNISPSAQLDSFRLLRNTPRPSSPNARISAAATTCRSHRLDHWPLPQDRPSSVTSLAGSAANGIAITL